MQFSQQQYEAIIGSLLVALHAKTKHKRKSWQKVMMYLALYKKRSIERRQLIQIVCREFSKPLVLQVVQEQKQLAVDKANERHLNGAKHLCLLAIQK